MTDTAAVNQEPDGPHAPTGVNAARRMAIEAGQRVFGGRYEARRLVGSGGMAEVYLAYDQLLDREVAVKALNDNLARDPQFVERFRREIHLAARLQHPHIVPLLSAGESGGLLYYTMPFVEGESLRDMLRREGNDFVVVARGSAPPPEMPPDDGEGALMCEVSLSDYHFQRLRREPKGWHPRVAGYWHTQITSATVSNHRVETPGALGA
jgi:hypothetical protein